LNKTLSGFDISMAMGIKAHYRLGGVDSLWHPLELDAQAQAAHCAEVQRLLTSRYLRLHSEFGVAGFQTTNIRRTA
jgi:hypothetical protein